MFMVNHTVISDDIATFQFECDIYHCRGACCVSGNAGAPVLQKEIPVLKKAWNKLCSELSPRAREIVKAEGLIKNAWLAPEINCVDGNECVFVQYDSNKTAKCAIHQAWVEGRFDWIKPLSCHLFPIRVLYEEEREYLNLQYVPSICRPAADRGNSLGVYLSDFMEDALVRSYGRNWYETFRKACEEVRENKRKKRC